MQSERPYYDYHVFCCINERSKDHPRGSCGRKNSAALRRYFKEKAKALKSKRIRINAAQCLDRCELGPVMVIYPEGVWYRAETTDDIDEILENHLMKGKIIERLRLTNDQETLDDL